MRPQLETTGLNDWLVYWPVEGGADSYGRNRVGEAKELPARWEIGGSVSRTATTRSLAKAAGVDVPKDLPLGTIVWQGRLETLPESVPQEDLLVVVASDVTPDVKSRHSRISLTLAKFKKALPTAS